MLAKLKLLGRRFHKHRAVAAQKIEENPDYDPSIYDENPGGLPDDWEGIQPQPYKDASFVRHFRRTDISGAYKIRDLEEDEDSDADSDEAYQTPRQTGESSGEKKDEKTLTKEEEAATAEAEMTLTTRAWRWWTRQCLRVQCAKVLIVTLSFANITVEVTDDTTTTTRPHCRLSVIEGEVSYLTETENRSLTQRGTRAWQRFIDRYADQNKIFIRADNESSASPSLPPPSSFFFSLYHLLLPPSLPLLLLPPPSITSSFLLLLLPLSPPPSTFSAVVFPRLAIAPLYPCCLPATSHLRPCHSPRAQYHSLSLHPPLRRHPPRSSIPFSTVPALPP